MSEDQPTQVASIAEEYKYIASLACDNCSDRYSLLRQGLLLPPDGPPIDRMELVCQKCGHSKVALFDISSFFGR